jgi:hypothetical protein
MGSNHELAPGIAFPITPSDSTDLTDTVTSGTGMGRVIIRAIIVNVGGNVAYLDPGGVGRTITLPSGCFPIVAKRIMSTNTTATGISGIV